MELFLFIHYFLYGLFLVFLVFGVQNCILSTLPVNKEGTVGYITAQGRDDPIKPGGFVFKYTGVVGSGKTYLGRAYGRSSTVVFYKSYMSDVTVPEGWSSWHNKVHEHDPSATSFLF